MSKGYFLNREKLLAQPKFGPPVGIEKPESMNSSSAYDADASSAASSAASFASSARGEPKTFKRILDREKLLKQKKFGSPQGLEKPEPSAAAASASAGEPNRTSRAEFPDIQLDLDINKSAIQYVKEEIKILKKIKSQKNKQKYENALMRLYRLKEERDKIYDYLIQNMKQQLKEQKALSRKISASLNPQKDSDEDVVFNTELSDSSLVRYKSDSESDSSGGYKRKSLFKKNRTKKRKYRGKSTKKKSKYRRKSRKRKYRRKYTKRK